MSRPITRARLAEEAQVKAFCDHVNAYADSVATPEKFIKGLLAALDEPIGLQGTCIFYGFVNRALERSITSDLNVNHHGRSTSIVKILDVIYVKAKAILLTDVDAMLAKPTALTPVWMINLTKKWILEYLSLFDYLIERSTSSSPIVAQHRKRIMLERVEAFHKSPYYLELGACLYDPVKFDNGWFEDHAMFDEDGLLE